MLKRQKELLIKSIPGQSNSLHNLDLPAMFLILMNKRNGSKDVELDLDSN